jgi:hypothetical protein
MRRPRIARSVCSLAPTSSCPSKRILPPAITPVLPRYPMIAIAVVLFPQPDSPISP